MNHPASSATLAPPQPHRPSTSCDRHPEERFTGFCPSCLSDRLSLLNNVASSSKNEAFSSLPELRRTKSSSARKNEPFSFSVSAFEPGRRSCDVRARNTLWSLFNADSDIKEKTLTANCEIVKSPVSEEDINCGPYKKPTRSVIVEEEEEQMELKPNRDFKASFWSGFSKKLRQWRQKQRIKKHCVGSAALPVEKPIGNQLRDTQSEIAEYRRSCDTDPRFSIDAGRFSLDAARVSVDEPRASWDAYMIGRTRMSSMLSVVEDSPVSNHVFRSDTHIPVEEPPPVVTAMEEIVPGGFEQTREYYYNESSSRRRKIVDRCSSARKMSASSVVSEIDELKLSASKTKTLSCQDRDVKDSVSHSNSLKEDCSAVNESSKNGRKRSKRWSWNIFGMLRNRYKEEGGGGGGVDRNVETRNGFDPKMMRSNSSVSWRSSGLQQRNSVDGYVSGKKKVTNGRKVENGMLKCSLTPSKGRRRGGSMDFTEQAYRLAPAPHP